MAKCKDFMVGCGLAVVTSLMWLVSACSPSATNTVPITPSNNSISLTTATTAVTPPAITNSPPEVSPTATVPPPESNTTSLGNQSTNKPVFVGLPALPYSRRPHYTGLS